MSTIKAINWLKYRPEQYHRFQSVISNANSPIQTIYIYGATYCGKTAMCIDLLKNNNFIIIDCSIYNSNASIFTHIAIQLYHIASKLSSKISINNKITCNKLLDIIDLYNQLDIFTDKKVYLVFDNIHVLYDKNLKLLQSLFHIHKLLSNRSMTLILIGQGYYNFYQYTTYIHEIYYSLYTEEQLIDILYDIEYPLVSDLCTSDEFINFITLIVSMFIHHTANLKELRYIIRQLFPKYQLKQCDSSEMMSVHYLKVLKPAISENITHLYQHFLTSNTYNHRTTLNQADFDATTEPSTSTSTNTIDDDDHQAKKKANKHELLASLSQVAKYLLFAAFLASYNPPNEDLNYFSSNHRKKRRKKRKNKNATKYIEQIYLGPKSFPMDRMIGIYIEIKKKKNLSI